MDKVTISRKEWQLVLFFSIGVMLATILPYLYGIWITPPNKQFMGVSITNSMDQYWYTSLIEQAKEGRVIFRYLSFSESHDPVIFHPLFLLMGWFTNIFKMPIALTYHLFRVMIGFTFLWLSYTFIAQFTENVLKRKIAFVLLALGSGFGWVAISLTNFKYPYLFIDIWRKEINEFLTLYHAPLDLAGTILMLVTFLSFLKLLNQPRPRYAFICGLSMLLLLIIHPYEIFTVILTLILYSGYLYAHKRISIKYLWNKFIIIFFLMLPGVIYNYRAITESPALKFWFESASVLSPPIISYFLGFGLLAVFSLAAIYKILRKKQLDNLHFILIWLAAAFFLAYQPWLQFQERFLEGIEIPIAILAAEGIFLLYTRVQEKLPQIAANFLILSLVMIMIFTNVTIIALNIEEYNTGSRPFYVENEYMEAFDWLRNNTSKDQIVFAHPNMSYFIPPYSGNPVFLGLLIYENTPYHQKKISELKWFFESKDDIQKRYEFLKKNNIAYFLYTPETIRERSYTEISEYNSRYSVSDSFDPEKITGLRKVYSNNKATIYKVE